MKFPYKKLAGRLLLIVPIEVKGKEWVSYDTYVDSGAGYSIFHSDVAEDLEISLEDGDKVYITVGDGSQIIAYLHKILVRIADQKFKVTIGFSERLGIGFNIIGQEDIFDRFKICFDRNEKVIEFLTR